MQIFTLNSDQIEFVRAWLKDPTVIIFFWHLISKGYKKAISEMEENIMSNVKIYIDDKFEQHEKNAFGRIAALEAAVRGCNEKEGFRK